MVWGSFLKSNWMWSSPRDPCANYCSFCGPFHESTMPEFHRPYRPTCFSNVRLEATNQFARHPRTRNSSMHGSKTYGPSIHAIDETQNTEYWDRHRSGWHLLALNGAVSSPQNIFGLLFPMILGRKSSGTTDAVYVSPIHPRESDPSMSSQGDGGSLFRPSVWKGTENRPDNVHLPGHLKRFGTGHLAVTLHSPLHKTSPLNG